MAGPTLTSKVLATAAGPRTATERVEFHCRPSEKAPRHLIKLAEDQRYEFVFLSLCPKHRAPYPARLTNRFPASAGLREAQAKN